jgi:hypothetical protein
MVTSVVLWEIRADKEVRCRSHRQWAISGRIERHAEEMNAPKPQGSAANAVVGANQSNLEGVREDERTR